MKAQLMGVRYKAGARYAFDATFRASVISTCWHTTQNRGPHLKQVRFVRGNLYCAGSCAMQTLRFHSCTTSNDADDVLLGLEPPCGLRVSVLERRT